MQNADRLLANYFKLAFFLLVLFVLNYFFENLYLFINSELHNHSTYKSNDNAPSVILNLPDKTLLFVKIAVNLIQITGNFLLAYLLLMSLRINTFQFKTGLGIFLVSYALLTAAALISILLSGGLVLVKGLNILAIARSPLLILFLLLLTYLNSLVTRS